MSDKLPERHIVVKIGIAILKLMLPREWILRNQTESDYGIDVEVDNFKDEKVTGQIFKSRFRPKSSSKWAQTKTC